MFKPFDMRQIIQQRMQMDQQGRQNRLSDLQYQNAMIENRNLPTQIGYATRLAQLQLEQAEREADNPELGTTYGKTIAAWGTDSNGKPVPLFAGEHGQLKVPDMPEGVTGYMEPQKMIDFGPYVQGYGSRTGQPTTGQLPKGLPPEKQPQNIKDAEGAKIEGQREAESNSPDAQNAKDTRYQDNISVISDIDDLLVLREDSNPMLSYAYGRENTITPDFAKPQAWIDAEAMRDRVIANLQLENVKKLKGTGPITENEQVILRRAATILGNPMISTPLAEKEMRRVRTMFQRWAEDNKRIGYVVPNENSGPSADYLERRKAVLGNE